MEDPACIGRWGCGSQEKQCNQDSGPTNGPKFILCSQNDLDGFAYRNKRADEVIHSRGLAGYLGVVSGGGLRKCRTGFLVGFTLSSRSKSG